MTWWKKKASYFCKEFSVKASRNLYNKSIHKKIVTDHSAHHITSILLTSIDICEWIKQTFHIVLPSAIFETFNILTSVLLWISARDLIKDLQREREMWFFTCFMEHTQTDSPDMQFHDCTWNCKWVSWPDCCS
jgi:hypothetical protein